MLDALRRYPVTFGLIALNLIAFAVEALQSHPFSAQSLVDLGATYGWLIAAKGEWWRIITGTFLHGGFTHIALNMFSLYVVGKVTEELFGRGEYLLLYLASGIAGAALSVAVHPEGLSVGASGAIFGIFGAIAGYALANRHRLGERFKRFMREFGAVLGLNLVLGFTIPGIDMSAHIGGLIVGFVGGYLARYPRAVWGWTLLMLALAFGYVIFLFPGTFAPQGLMR